MDFEHSMTGPDTAQMEHSFVFALAAELKETYIMTSYSWESLKQNLKTAVITVGQIVYGASIYEMVRDLKKERSHIEHLFMLVVFGDLLGVPVLPPYYTLRLLPYVMPVIRGWQVTMLRERDITDLCDQEIT